jgi:hypothetical protein
VAPFHEPGQDRRIYAAETWQHQRGVVGSKRGPGATFLPHKCGDPKASRFMAPMRVQSWRWRLPMNPAFVAADVRRLKLLEQNEMRGSLRRLLRFMDSRREISFRGILSPPSGERARRGECPWWFNGARRARSSGWLLPVGRGEGEAGLGRSPGMTSPETLEVRSALEPFIVSNRQLFQS